MLTGKLWLDYDVGDEEEHFEAKVSRAILRDAEIVLEFSGHNPDEGAFHGNCKLAVSGDAYSGPGTFTVLGKSYESLVYVRLEAEQGMTELAGTWHITGDSHPYDLSAELEDT